MRWLIVVVLLLTTACRCSQDAEEFPSYLSGPRHPKVSLIHLIANPKPYDGVDVQVIGFLGALQGVDSVFLHRADYENAVLLNSVRLQLPQEMNYSPMPACYVAIEGMFVFSPVADTGQVGRLQVTQIASWFLAKDPQECRR